MKPIDKDLPGKTYIIVCCASVLFLVYLFGIASVKWKIWPYPTFEKGFQAGKAWYEKIRPFSPYDTSFYDKANHDKGGVFKYDSKKVFDGLTFFTFGLDHKALLISMDGKIVHQWHMPFSSVWPDPPHITSPVVDGLINMSAPYLYPNGDVLAIYATDRDTPYGYGLVKIDKNSNVIWKYEGRVHHDVDVGRDGKIYLLTHEMIKEKIPGLNISPPIMDDFVVVLSPDGRELGKVSITEGFYNSEFKDVLKNVKGWEPWHANNVEVLDDNIADKFPFLTKGCVLVSLKSATAIAAIDLFKKKVIWAIRGPWIGQHDPDFLENGNMLIFDNKGHFSKGGRSRIVEFDPETMETIWEYTGDNVNPFFSAIRSTQQRLPNGNTLITESDNGRIFEVTRAREIVWDYRSPYRAPHDNRLVAVVMRAQRFDRDYFEFSFTQAKYFNSQIQ